jgi:hypothetical protein
MSAIIMNKLHPAAEWASKQTFNTINIDCITTIVVKILDGKCKMNTGEISAIMEIYDMACFNKGILFREEEHALIREARESSSESALLRIHELRKHAESVIPKPVMKMFKSRLRDGLFG